MDIEAWLRELGLERYAHAFRENAIGVDVLPQLTDEHLKDLGLPLGDRLRLLKAVAVLAGRAEPRSAAEARPRASSDTAPAARPAKAERRQLTVMFCDLVGSTELSARLDPEDMGAVIRAYQEGCAEVVRRWDGHIAKYMGDGVLVYFGYPRAHEDDAERALRAGLELVKEVGRLEPMTDLALATRVGIATGLVMVGELIGAGASREETVVGETPNLAARLQALAKPGTVVISQATRRLVGGLFELDDLGPQRLKGFAGPLTAWRVARASLAEGRFEARQAGRLTPLVGREEEISLLLRRWRQASEGEGQVVLLSGEPGIGKSRLVRELRQRVEDESHVRLLYQCSPHHTTSPLHPLIEQLERAAGFARDDPPEVRLDKLETLLARGTDRLDQAVPLIAALLGVPTGERYPAPELTPQRQKQRTLEVLVDQLEGLAAEQPVLLAYEDVHWIDPTTQELLQLAIDRVQRLTVLLLITFRPEFVPPPSGQPHVSALALTRLGRRDGAAMVEQVVGDKTLPAEVSAQIVAKTDGVPLFVEELTKTVLESGLLSDAGDRYELTGPLPPLAIPATLHDSLLARFDRLAPVKEVAQIGAAIGRQFSHALLAAVANWPEAQLHAALDQLVSSELIFRRGVPPEASYSFKHALVQDAAYGTLLKSKRQHLHARIAQVLEKQFPETAEAQPELLAEHLTEAGLIAPAIHHWQRAGERAAGRSANVEAARHLQKGLTLLERLPEGDERDGQELRLLTALGPALMAIQGWCAPAVESLYARARVVASTLGRSADLFPTVWGWWFVAHTRADYDTTADIVNELLHLAESEGEPGLVLQAHHAAWATRMSAGDLAGARDSAEAGIRLYRRETHGQHALVYGGHDPGVCGVAHAAHLLWMLGYPEQAKVRGAEALALARDLGHKDTLAHALWLACELHLYRREVRETAETAEALRVLATEQGLLMYATLGTMLGAWALAGGGQVREALDQLRRGLVTWQDDREAIAPNTVRLAEVCIAAGEADEGLRLVNEALAQITRSRQRLYEAELLRLRGALLLLSPAPDLSAAEVSFRMALAVAREQNARMWELRTATSLARLWDDQGRRSEARDLLAPIFGWFTEGFDTADLKDAKTLLDEWNEPSKSRPH